MKTEDVILTAFKNLTSGSVSKVEMESDTHKIKAYKVGIVIRIDIKPKKEEGT